MKTVSPPMISEEIQAVRHIAERLFSPTEIELSVDTMALAISERLAEKNPLVLAIMTGGMVPAGMLMTRLTFPLEIDYIHLTRYGTSTSGGEIQWLRQPPADLQGRTVLLVDDLLDRGITLQSAVERCYENGAHEVLTAVLLVKQIPDRPGLAATDFFALATTDRYVFGFGMDYKKYWRNCPGIFAVKNA